MDVVVPVSLLSRIVGLSERGLRDAFYQVRGMSPKRWIVSERLQGVRDALTHACAEPTTVTDAAVNHGFYELGRFAGIYRAAFGEAPSDTLRSTHQKTGATPRRMRTRQCFRQRVK
jgi:AraC family ethanolamine operon transcriptional activator